MTEILNAIKTKDKITIVGIMAAFAVILAVLVGVLTLVTADRHTHIYDYSLAMNDDGSFSVKGVCTVENCENPFFSKDIESGVKLLSAISPTCSSEGSKVYTYAFGDIGLRYTEILPKAPHFYDYELVKRNEKLYINGICTIKGCKDPYIFLNDVEELTLISVVPATCFSPREETYSYVTKNETGTFKTLVEEFVPHTLNGIPVTDLADDYGRYPVSTPGVFPATQAKPACSAVIDGCFICDVCRELEPIKLVYPPHEFVYSENNLTPPTLTSKGLAILTCKNSGCEETIEIDIPKVVPGENTVQKSAATELHPEILTYLYESKEFGFKIERDYEVGQPLGHNYVYSLEFDKDDSSKFDLVGICSQPECQTPEVREKDVATSFEDTSTCTKKGYWIWTHVTSEGKEYKIRMESIAFADHSYSYAIPDVKPSLNSGIELELFCTNDKCSHRTTVQLPKVVIGENATQIAETDTYIIVDYLYVTKDGFEVTLTILIDK